MFKKLTLLVLIALIAIPAATACSSKATGEIAPPAVAATEQEPANPTSMTTPSQKISEKNLGEAISREELIELIEKGELSAGDIVLLSGIVERAALDFKEISPDKSSFADFVLLGPDVESPSVRIELAETQKVKYGEKITVKGTIYLDYTEVNSEKKHLTQIFIKNAVIR